MTAPRIAIAAVITAAVVTTAAAPITTAAPPPLPGDQRIALDWMWPRIKPCAYEDSRNCKWNASVRGDGQGTSFIDLNGHAYYMPWKDS